MSLKTRIRVWLDVPDIPKPRAWDKEFADAIEKYRKESTIEFERIIKQLRAVSCINCKRPLVEGKNAVYTNFKAQKFCSHECIDKFAKKKGRK